MRTNTLTSFGAFRVIRRLVVDIIVFTHQR
jgi:hypothetical protein